MKRLGVLVVIGAVVAAVSSETAIADPPNVNGHNCAGLTSTFVPEENLGEAVRGIARAFPTAIPTSLDFADCGGNGFPP